MNYSNRQKCFAIMMIMAVLMLFMTGSFTAYADEDTAVIENEIEEDEYVNPKARIMEAPEGFEDEEDEYVNPKAKLADAPDAQVGDGEVILYSTFSEDIPEEENALLYSTTSEELNPNARLISAPHEETTGDKIDKAFYNFDVAVYRFFGKLQNSATLVVSKLFTSFGDEDFVIPVAVLSLVLCLFKRTRKYGFSILFAIAVGTVLVNLVLKPAVLRIRPYNTLQLTGFWNEYSVWYKAAGSLSESDYSFPSGHTNSAFEMATAVFLCMMGDKKKRKIAWIFPVIALMVMCSRIMLMVHYPSDVVVGAVAGIAAGVVAFLLAKLACIIFTKVKFLDAIDLEKLFKKGINTKAAAIVITAVCCIFLGFSFGRLMNESEEVKCAYNVEYDCNNKARVGEEKYPEINGESYCKIHWKQLSGVEE